MSDIAEVTEWVRFNDDGSSDHIKVFDDRLVEAEHYDVAPYVRMNGAPFSKVDDLSWIVFVSHKPEPPNDR